MLNKLSSSKPRISLFNRPRKATNTIEELKPLINNKNFQYNHRKCEQEYFRAMDLRAIDDQSSKKEAIKILQDLFYNKMMSYETDESSYILKEHIVLNYWKLLQEVRKGNSDSKMILRMLRIGYLYLNEQYLSILPKINHLQLLCLILAREQYAGQCYNQALNVCHQAENLDHKLTKDKSTLLKIHYLKVKIYTKMQQPQFELKQINKCFHYLSTLTQKQKDSTYSSFRKNLILRKQQLLAEKRDVLGIISKKDLIRNSAQYQKQSNQKFKLKPQNFRVKSESKLRKKSQSKQNLINRRSCDNKEDQSLDMKNRSIHRKQQPAKSQGQFQQFMKYNIQAKKKTNIKTDYNILKDKKKFPVKVFQDRIKFGQGNSKLPLKLDREYQHIRNKSNILIRNKSNITLRKNQNIEQIMQEVSKNQQNSSMAPYLNYLIYRPGKGDSIDSFNKNPNKYLALNQNKQKCQSLQVQNNYKCFIFQSSKQFCNDETIRKVVNLYQQQVLNKFLIKATQQKKQLSSSLKQQYYKQNSYQQQQQEDADFIMNDLAQFSDNQKSKFCIFHHDPLDDKVSEIMHFLLDTRFGYVIRGEAKISRVWENVQSNTIKSLAALFYSTKKNMLQEKTQNIQYSIKIQGSLIFSNYSFARFQLKMPQIYKTNKKLYNILQERATKEFKDMKNLEYMNQQQNKKRVKMHITTIICEALSQKSQYLQLHIKQPEFKFRDKYFSKSAMKQANPQKFSQLCQIYYWRKTYLDSIKTIAFEKYFWIKLYQQYNTTLSYQTKKKQQQTQKLRINHSIGQSRTSNCLKSKNNNTKMPQYLQIEFFDSQNKSYNTLQIKSTAYPKIMLKKILLNKRKICSYSVTELKLSKQFGQNINYLSEQLQKKEKKSLLTINIQRLQYFLKSNRKLHNERRQTIFLNCMKHLLIQFTDQSSNQLLKFFKVQKASFLSNISNNHYVVKIEKYTAKQLYSDLGESFYKFQFQKSCSATRKKVLILTDIDIQNILGNSEIQKPLDFNNPRIHDNLCQFCKKIVIRRGYLYNKIGIITDQRRFYWKNDFRNSLHLSRNKKSFLQLKLTLLKILYQRVSVIQIDLKKIYSVITISTIENSNLYQLRIYFPSICRNYSMCFDRNIVKYFNSDFLSKVFADQIDQSLSKQQAIKKYNKLLTQHYENRARTGKYWNQITKSLCFEIVRNRQQENLIVKICYFRGYLRDSSVVHYLQIGGNILKIEITLKKKESKLKIINYNMVLVNVLQQIKDIQRCSITQSLIGKTVVNQKLGYGNINKRIKRCSRFEQCIQSQVIKGVECISEEKTDQCLVYVSITNIDYQKTVNFKYKLTQFLKLVKSQQQINQPKNHQLNQKKQSKQVTEKKQQMELSSQLLGTFSQSQQSLQYRLQDLNQKTYNDFKEQTFSYAKILRGFETVKQILIQNLISLYSVKKLFWCDITQYNFNKKVKQNFDCFLSKPNVKKKHQESQVQRNQKLYNINRLHNSSSFQPQNKGLHEPSLKMRKINKMIQRTSRFTTIYTSILDIERKKMSKIIFDSQNKAFQFHFLDSQNFVHKARQISIQNIGYPFICFYDKKHLKFMKKRIFCYNKNLILTQ